MISVEQAIEIVNSKSRSTQKTESKNLSAARGHILFEDVVSPINMPPFRQSAMDGYALCLNGNTEYTIVGEVKAGDSQHLVLNPGEAVRIFTGAPVPDSADAVIMQERTQVADDKLTIDAPVQAGDNIRPRGEQVLKEDIALKKGTKLTPAGIAFLMALGITKVCVCAKPSIAIVVTGDELAEAGKDLEYGQIYESNAVMLRIVLDQLDYQNVSTHKVADVYDDTLSTLKSVISNHDVILVSGGISVGDYDFVGKALAELGVEQCFYKIKQKPGKPLFFGKKGDKLIFALPGNPASALSCFYIYVLTALELRSGNGNFTLPRTKAQSVSDFTKKGDRSQFLKAIYTDGSVEILEGQSSSMLHTFALANALVYVRETADSIKINDTVEVILLPIY